MLYQQGGRPASPPAYVLSTAVEMKTEKPNFAFELDAADLPALLSDPAVCAAAIARVERCPHDLIQQNFHNPLTTPLIFPPI